MDFWAPEGRGTVLLTSVHTHAPKPLLKQLVGRGAGAVRVSKTLAHGAKILNICPSVVSS